MKLVKEFSDVSNENFWCELGYSDDLNNRTEKGYLPFHIVVFGRTNHPELNY